MLVGKFNPSATTSTDSLSSCNIGPLFGPKILVIGLVDIRITATAMPVRAAVDIITGLPNLFFIFKGIAVPLIIEEPGYNQSPAI
jgi:hypothetical protein